MADSLPSLLQVTPLTPSSHSASENETSYTSPSDHVAIDMIHLHTDSIATGQQASNPFLALIV